MSNMPPPPTGMTHCRNCGGTVFVQKRGKFATVLGIVMLFVFIVPGILILAFAPKHTRCAACGKAL